MEIVEMVASLFMKGLGFLILFLLILIFAYCVGRVSGVGFGRSLTEIKKKGEKDEAIRSQKNDEGPNGKTGPRIVQ